MDFIFQQLYRREEELISQINKEEIELLDLKNKLRECKELINIHTFQFFIRMSLGIILITSYPSNHSSSIKFNNEEVGLYSIINKHTFPLIIRDIITIYTLNNISYKFKLFSKSLLSTIELKKNILKRVDSINSNKDKLLNLKKDIELRSKRYEALNKDIMSDIRRKDKVKFTQSHKLKSIGESSNINTHHSERVQFKVVQTHRINHIS